jgi:NTP pyrophosphatase (non-canonical NTP hydrolase)
MNMHQITISQLQKYIKEQDYNPDLKQGYFLKLAEEVGELARAMHKNVTPATESEFKGTIEEELYDVIYYVLAIANCYDIDVDKWIYVKEKLNDIKYNRGNHADSLLSTE